MSIQRAKTLISKFFELSVAEYRFHSANLWTSEADENIVARYERVAGVQAQDGRIANLIYEQSELCFAELLTDEATFRANGINLSLWQDFHITRWRINDSQPSTKSVLGIQYDIRPHLSTTLAFESVDQFDHVRGVLADIGLCQLNERHLKPVKNTSHLRRLL